MGSDFIYVSDFEKASINLELSNVSTQNLCEYILERIEPGDTDEETADKLTDINMATNRRQSNVQRRKSFSINSFQQKTRKKSIDAEVVPVIAESVSDTNPDVVSQTQGSDDVSTDIKADVPVVVIPSIEEESDELSDLIGSENVKKGATAVRHISFPGVSNPGLLTGSFSDIERSSSRMKFRSVVVG